MNILFTYERHQRVELKEIFQLMKAERDPTVGTKVSVIRYRPSYGMVWYYRDRGKRSIQEAPQRSAAHKTDESICVYAHVSMHLVSVRVCE